MADRITAEQLKESVDKGLSIQFKNKVKGVALNVLRTPTAPEGDDNYTAMLLVDDVPQASGNFQPWESLSLLVTRFVAAKTPKAIAKEFAVFNQKFTADEILERITTKENLGWWFLSFPAVTTKSEPVVDG
jgi:hypothetical protein